MTVIALTALAAGVVYAYNHVRWFRNGVTGLSGTMKSVGKWIAGAFVTIWDKLATAIRTALAPLLAMYDLAKKVVNLNPLGTHVSGHGSNAQYNQLRQKAGALGIHVPAHNPSVVRSNVATNRLSAVQGIGATRLNANGQPGTPSNSGDSNGGDAGFHHTTVLGTRVIAEEVVRYARRGNALSGAFAGS